MSKDDAEMNNNNICLVITGCFKPAGGVTRLCLTDEVERKKQYIDAIAYFINDTKIKNIIYCDSSGAEEEEMLIRLAQGNKKNFEWLSFEGNAEAVVNQGKGYGEGEIIQYILENSKIIEQCNYFIKITGRLIVKNIDILLKCSKEMNYFFPITVRFGKKFVDTRFYIVKKRDYEECLLQAYKDVDDNKNFFLEHAIAEQMTNSGMTFRHFLVEPNIEGISGSRGVYYHTSSIKIVFKSILNCFNISIDAMKHR